MSKCFFSLNFLLFLFVFLQRDMLSVFVLVFIFDLCLNFWTHEFSPDSHGF